MNHETCHFYCAVFVLFNSFFLLVPSTTEWILLLAFAGRNKRLGIPRNKWWKSIWYKEYQNSPNNVCITKKYIVWILPRKGLLFTLDLTGSLFKVVPHEARIIVIYHLQDYENCNQKKKKNQKRKNTHLQVKCLFLLGFSPPSEIISSSCPIQNRSYNMQHEPDSMLKKKIHKWRWKWYIQSKKESRMKCFVSTNLHYPQSCKRWK